MQYESSEFLYGYDNEATFSSSISPHIHVGWELLFVKHGELSYTVDGNVFDIKPGSLIIARPGEIHTLYSKGTIHYERHSLITTGSLLNQDILTKIPADLHVLDVSGNNIILGLYEKFGLYLANLQGNYLEIAFRSLINELWLNIYMVTQASSPAVTPSANPVIAKAIDFIKDHIREPLTVRQVSEALFITPCYLHQCFAKHMNITPKQYIMLQKLQRVQQALINAENPTTVCRYYGFQNYSTFYRNYQKIYGCRPSDSPQRPLQKIEL